MTTPNRKPSKADIKSQYGFVAELSKSVPEINRILKRAIQEQWTAQRFSMAVADTRWWRKNAATTREWLVQKITDPRTAEIEMRNGAHKVQNRAEYLGVPIPSWERAKRIWLNGMLQGFGDSGQHFDAHVYLTTRSKKQNPYDLIKNSGGLIGSLASEMIQMGFDYDYLGGDWEKTPAGRSAAREIVSHIDDIMQAGGEGSLDSWKNKMINYAASKYAPFAERIRAGETPMAIARPYMQVVSEVLEIPETELTLREKLIERAMQGTMNEQGAAVGMTTWQVAQAARKDARWRTTNNARTAVGSLLTEIGTRFGKIA